MTRARRGGPGSGVGTNDFKKGGKKVEEEEDNIPMPPPPPVVEKEGVEDVEPGPVEEYLEAKDNADKLKAAAAAAKKGEPVDGDKGKIQVNGGSVPEGGIVDIEGATSISKEEGEESCEKAEDDTEAEVDGEPEQDAEAEEEGGDDEPPEDDDTTGPGETADEGSDTGTKKITRRNWSGMDDTQRRQFLSEQIEKLQGKAGDLSFTIALKPLGKEIPPMDAARMRLENVVSAATAALKNLEDIEPAPAEDSYTRERLQAMSMSELGAILAGA